MKRLFTLVSVLAVTATATYAQRAISGEISGKSRAMSTTQDKADTTVLLTPAFANPVAGCDTLTLYGTNGGGVVTGFNEYGDLEKAAIFSGSGSVIAVFAQVGAAVSNTGFEDTPFAAKIYSVNLSDSSFTQLGVSTGIPVSTIDDSSGTPTIWPLTATLTGGVFAASIEVGNYGSNSLNAGLAILGTKEDCGNGDLAFEKWNDDTWHALSVAWPIELELSIGVAVTGFASNPDVELISGMTLFPNPVEDQFNLAYTSAVSGNVRIDIIDATGRTIQVVNDGYKTAGTYNTNIQTQNLAAGLYTYRLTMGGKQAQGKFIVK